MKITRVGLLVTSVDDPLVDACNLNKMKPRPGCNNSVSWIKLDLLRNIFANPPPELRHSCVNTGAVAEILQYFSWIMKIFFWLIKEFLCVCVKFSYMNHLIPLATSNTPTCQSCKEPSVVVPRNHQRSSTVSLTCIPTSIHVSGTQEYPRYVLALARLSEEPLAEVVGDDGHLHLPQLVGHQLPLLLDLAPASDPAQPSNQVIIRAGKTNWKYMRLEIHFVISSTVLSSVFLTQSKISKTNLECNTLYINLKKNNIEFFGEIVKSWMHLDFQYFLVQMPGRFSLTPHVKFSKSNLQSRYILSL